VFGEHDHAEGEMKFVLEVDLGAGPPVSSSELSRILRFWSRSVGYTPLVPGVVRAVYDSQDELVGAWRVEDGSILASSGRSAVGRP
jgi:hypothetical protein